MSDIEREMDQQMTDDVNRIAVAVVGGPCAWDTAPVRVGALSWRAGYRAAMEAVRAIATEQIAGLSLDVDLGDTAVDPTEDIPDDGERVEDIVQREWDQRHPHDGDTE